MAAIGPDDSPARWVISLGLSVSCSVWCVADGATRKQVLVWHARIGIFFFWPIGVPIYLVWSRGGRGVVMSAVAVVGWIAVTFAAFMVSGYMAYGLP